MHCISFIVLTLNLLETTFRSAPSPALFACDEKILQGSCRLFKRSGSYKANKMKGWSDKIVSFFIAGINFDFFVILSSHLFTFSEAVTAGIL